MRNCGRNPILQALAPVQVHVPVTEPGTDYRFRIALVVPVPVLVETFGSSRVLLRMQQLCCQNNVL